MYPKIKPLITWILTCFLLLAFPNNIEAKTDDQFITIVNPVRVSSYTANPERSIEAEYRVVKNYNLPSTWLLSYDTLINDKIIAIVKKMDDQQELGILLEVSPAFAEASGVIYHNTGFWHHANALFLSGYTQAERPKLIDTVFTKFKAVFGYYPKSVGSWWTDSYSLAYLQNKYGVVANLGCSDQFGTDGYFLWGQPWMQPFYPSLNHSGIPAIDSSVKLNIVNLQWAARDPFLGYKNSLYSTQDYKQLGNLYDITYFEKLLDIYGLKNLNSFGQITVGLEADLSPETYDNEYTKQLDLVAKKTQQGIFQAVTMNQFGNWYNNKFSDLSPSGVIVTPEAIWYQSPKYRIGLTFDKALGELTVRDLRTYSANFQEPYYLTPNSQFNLTINNPSIIDSASNPQEAWIINGVNQINISGDYLDFKLESNQINFEFLPDKLLITSSLVDVPKLVTNLQPGLNFFYSTDGYPFKVLLPEKPLILRHKRTFGVILLVMLIGWFYLWKTRKSKFEKIIIVCFPLVIFALGFGYWYFSSNRRFFVSQAEVDTLIRLSRMETGKVVVYDRECVNCQWITPYKPAVFSNKRDYVTDISHQSIVYNSRIFTTTSREEGRQELKRIGAKYIYVVRYGDYQEIVPFSPGDYNLEKVYENANSTLWQIKSL